jgi:hypothetical protein
MSNELLKLKQRELQLYKQKLKLKTELPHLHGMKWYKWAREFFESTNRFRLLTAGNQLSKSSTQIRCCIDWATNKEKWKTLWPSSPVDPNVFWYLYPTLDVAHEEFKLKWSQFLPSGDMKEDNTYGWTSEFRNKKIYAIHFKSGVSVIFKSYAQSPEDLQTGTVYAVFCDEELPMSHFPELQARLNASDGYFSMVFTATLGQEYWRCAIEVKGDGEKHIDADKWQVSLYDCLTYEDGSPSPWTPEKVKRAEARCSSHNEYLRRIMGKFVVEGGLKYEAFQREKNVTKPHPLPKDWHIFGGVDPGSGGETGHPAAIVFVGVSPDYRQGRVFRARRMDGIQTTPQDVLEEYIRLRGKLIMTNQYYDWASKDFHTFATRRGEAFIKAEKDQELGVQHINTLFKAQMLKIFDGDPELEKLVNEIMTLKAKTAKRDANDNLVDAMRYTIMSLPWDWSVLDDIHFDKDAILEKPKPKEKTEIDLRREFVFGPTDTRDSVEQELEEWDNYINEFDS